MLNTLRISWFVLFSECAGVIAALIGVLVLIGWWQNIGILKSILPELVTMKANTAFSFLFTGVALFLMSTRSPLKVQRTIGRWLAAIVGSVTCLTLVEYSGTIDLGIDQLLFLDDVQANSTSHPGRMAPITAIALTLTSVALLLMDWNARISQRLAAIVLVLATLAIAGYVFGAPALYKVRAYTSIAVHTAVTLFILSLGIIFARPSAGHMEVIVSESIGGYTARRLFFTLLPLLFVLGWLVLLGRKADFYDDQFAMAIVIVLGMLLMTIIIIDVAQTIRYLDIKRQQSQDDLALINVNLERIVAERTSSLESVNQKLTEEVVERKLAEEEVRRLSLTDELTGLLNRRGFIMLAERELNVARRNNAVSTLIYIDLDGLKTVNDTLGHKAGDLMLKDAAIVLEATFRDIDIVARLGGDEFAILAVKGEQPEVILTRLNANLAQFEKGRESSYPLRFSAGVLQCLSTDQRSLLEMLADADALMYEQKQEHHLKQ